MGSTRDSVQGGKEEGGRIAGGNERVGSARAIKTRRGLLCFCLLSSSARSEARPWDQWMICCVKDVNCVILGGRTCREQQDTTAAALPLSYRPAGHGSSFCCWEDPAGGPGILHLPKRAKELPTGATDIMMSQWTPRSSELFSDFPSPRQRGFWMAVSQPPTRWVQH